MKKITAKNIKNEFSQSGIKITDKKIKFIFDNAPVMIAQLDENKKIVFWNKYGKKLLGYAEEEVVGKFSPKDFYENKKDAERIDIILNKKGYYDEEATWKRKDKKLVPVHVKVIKLKNLKGKTSNYIGFAEDITEHRKYEKKIEIIEKQYQQILSGSIQGLVVVQGFPPKFVFINKAFAKMLGYTSKEMSSLSGNNLIKMVHPEDRKSFFDNYQKRLRGEKVIENYIFRGFKKNGDVRWFEVYASYIDYFDKPAVQAAFVDVTERIISEKIINFSEEKYRKLFESTKDGIAILDIKTMKMIDVNPSFINILGFSKNYLIGKTFFESGIVNKNEENINKFNNLKKNKFIHCECVFNKKNEENVFVEFVSNSYSINNEQEVIQCNIRDITKRKENELLIMHEKVQRESLLNAIGDGVLAVDQNRKIMYLNSAAVEMLNLKKEEIVNKPYYEFFDVAINDEILGDDKRPLAIVLKNGEKITTSVLDNYYYVRKDKTRFPVSITVTPIVLDKKIVGAVAVLRDITKEKEIDKMKTEFVSLASHQLRTPITAINWNTEMLLNGDFGEINSEQKESLNDIYYNNGRMISLINALLNVSRLEMGTFMINSVMADIVKICRNNIGEFLPKIKEKKIKIIENYDAKIMPIKIDLRIANIIFQNLISNAVKYTKDKIEIEIKKSKDNLLIKFSDNGIGIPKNQQSKMFTKIFRADNAALKEPDGTGLGLYIVKLVLEQSGGKIWFESEEGKGATFYVSLPLKSNK